MCQHLTKLDKLLCRKYILVIALVLGVSLVGLALAVRIIVSL